MQGAGIIFVNWHQEVLLFLRDDKPAIPYPNTWDILGGGLESGETPEQCIVREIREEIEYELSQPALFQVSHIKEGTAYIFWQQAELDLAKTPLHEGQRLQWFSEAAIRAMAPAEIAFGFRDVLLAFFAQKPFAK
jgi:8-oxo-dGTP diphosphatase